MRYIMPHPRSLYGIMIVGQMARKGTAMNNNVEAANAAVVAAVAAASTAEVAWHVAADAAAAAHAKWVHAPTSEAWNAYVEAYDASGEADVTAQEAWEEVARLRFLANAAIKAAWAGIV